MTFKFPFLQKIFSFISECLLPLQSQNWCLGWVSHDYNVFNTRGGESLEEHNLPQMNKLSQSHLLLQWSLQKAEKVLRDRINLSSPLSHWLHFLAGLLSRTHNMPKKRPPAPYPHPAQLWSSQPSTSLLNVQNETFFFFFLWKGWWGHEKHTPKWNKELQQGRISFRLHKGLDISKP